MTWKKFEYFLNAVHYCMWRSNIAHHVFLRTNVLASISRISRYLVTREQQEGYESQLLEKNKEIEDLFRNKKIGFCTSWAHRSFNSFSTCYSAFFSFVLLGFGVRLYGNLSPFTMLFLIFSPICVCYIPIYKAVYSKDRYLRYFRKFEKEDERWHRKWSRITTLFCVGAVLSFIGGIFAMILLGPH